MDDTENIRIDLDRKYFMDPDGYLKKVETVKSAGYKVYRNSSGKHKVVYNKNFYNEMFDGVFGNIFWKR